MAKRKELIWLIGKWVSVLGMLTVALYGFVAVRSKSKNYVKKSHRFAPAGGESDGI